MNIEVLTNAAGWAAVVAFLQPVVLNFILQSGWSSRVQAIVAFLFSAVVATGTAGFAGAFTGVGIVTCVFIVAGGSIAFYEGFWKHVTPNLKASTSIVK